MACIKLINLFSINKDGFISKNIFLKNFVQFRSNNIYKIWGSKKYEGFYPFNDISTVNQT